MRWWHNSWVRPPGQHLQQRYLISPHSVSPTSMILQESLYPPRSWLCTNRLPGLTVTPASGRCPRLPPGAPGTHCPSPSPLKILVAHRLKIAALDHYINSFSASQQKLCTSFLKLLSTLAYYLPEFFSTLEPNFSACLLFCILSFSGHRP